MNDTIDRVDEYRRAAREIRALNRSARRGKHTKAGRRARARAFYRATGEVLR